MFEYVRLKNFKSFGDVELNLLDRNNNPKKMVLIYGENGIGKTNLASAFFMLSESLRTMDVRDFWAALLSDESVRLNDTEEIRKYFRARYKDIETLIKENKTVSSTEPMYMEFRFRVNGKSGRYLIEMNDSQINGKSGRYLIEMNDSQIIHERLEYILSQRRGVYYDIVPGKISISTKIFQDRKAYRTIKNSCDQFWGKHSLLAILLHESDDKADQYIKEKVGDNFDLLLHFFSRISCKIKFGSRLERGIIGLPPEIFGEYEKGEIDREDESLLDKTEQMLNAFFKLTYKDIVKAYYKRTYEEDSIVHRTYVHGV